MAFEIGTYDFSKYPLFLQTVAKINKISDINTYINDECTVLKGKIFELLTCCLFTVMPEFNDYEIYLYSDLSDDYREQYKLPNIDKGVDIVLRNADECIIVQCKYNKNIKTKLGYSMLSTFCGTFGYTDNINKGILVTNVIDVCDEVKNSSRINIMSNLYWETCLPENFFKNIVKAQKIRWVRNVNNVKEPVTYVNSLINLWRTDVDAFNHHFGLLISYITINHKVPNNINEKLNEKILRRFFIYVRHLYNVQMLPELYIDVMNNTLVYETYYKTYGLTECLNTH